MRRKRNTYEYPPLTDNLCEYRGGSWGISQRVKQKLGVTGGTIPANMKGRYLVDGHTVIVFKSGKTPKMPKKKGRSQYNPSAAKRYFHRVFFQDGGKHAPLIPVGRARQALKCSLRPGGNTLKARYH